MPTNHRRELARIKRFDQLVAYLRDEMDWPIEGEDFEDLTFEYTPEELGIDAKNAAKIQEIKRLRPLVPEQPWGIFFVKFEPKRLPVVALRRILSRVVLKKQAAGNSDERAAWQMADLLFISNYGDEEERRISFAHFVQDDDWGDLPTLKVLGWDGNDTGLKLDHVAAQLTTKLRWPEPKDVAEIENWRSNWASAFTLRHRQVITTSKQLAEALAVLARATYNKMREALAYEADAYTDENGPLRTLMDGFKKALIHDLDDDGFADMYAQTIAYGLLSARVSRPAGLTADNMADLVPVTNPFLKEMLESFLRLGGRRRSDQSATGIDFDELGINEIVQLLRDADMEAVLRDFDDKNPQEDPVIHFYEHFLTEYDAERRMRRGVFYTPRPVVSYIIRSADELLRTEFGLEDGLADTVTWGGMAERHADLSIPDGVSPDQPFVQILDPATGTGTFLVEVIELIHRTMTAKWQAQRYSQDHITELWNEYVSEHLLPRLHGYELLMAPYAIAHLKIGLRLHQTGYLFQSDERARVYLTNALEPATDGAKQMQFKELIPALAHEAQAVNEIKRNKRFTIIVGNPPYAKNSSNRSVEAEKLVSEYKRLVYGETNVQPLSDDYVKFLAFAFEASACTASLIGMITNRSYLEGLIHRGMRSILAHDCLRILVVDLHGDTNVGERPPPDMANENVFDIQQGVSISAFLRWVKRERNSAQLLRRDVWGTRQEKYKVLQESVAYAGALPLTISEPYWFFASKELDTQGEQVSWVSIDKLFRISGMGVKSRRDHFLIDETKEALHSRMLGLACCNEVERLREVLKVKDNSQWTLSKMRDLVAREGVADCIYPIMYRPFDVRYIWYHREAIERGDARWPVMKHVLPDGLSLLTARQSMNHDFTAAFIARGLSEMKTAESTRGSYSFPERLQETSGKIGLEADASNIRSELLGNSLQKRSPDGVISYIYAVLHSPAYRSRYAGALRIEFPKIPTTCSPELAQRLCGLGRDLVSLHLMESAILEEFITTYAGPKHPEVGRVGWSDGTVWLDAGRTSAREGYRAADAGAIGFVGVPKEVWDFHIGGYQVCHKWLKDRKGRTLSDQDITHYQKIIVAISETIRIMREIDEVIEAHGGWPGAFVTGKAVTDAG
jgi:hypothetical protein